MSASLKMFRLHYPWIAFHMRTYHPQSTLLCLTPYPLSKGEGRDMLQDTDGEPMMEKLKNPQSILLPSPLERGWG